MTSLPSYQFTVLFLLLLAASAIAAWFIFDMKKTIKRFLGQTGTDIEEDVLHGLMRRIARLEAKAEEFDPRIDLLEKVATTSIQKTGFVRFNPFQDTGGDNSFILVLLDRTNTGVVLSSLYMREGIRLYAKSVEGGKPKHVLSEEEKRVLEDTMRN
ncbi:MAG: DUF4446 family protein [bacterium]|nr:DUF4446 family protein [bacterium]